MSNKKWLIRASQSGALMTDKKGEVITKNQLAELSGLIDRKNLYVADPIRNVKKKLTQNMEDKVVELTAKRDKPFELSDTAKGEIRKIWRFRERGIIDFTKSKYLDKGIIAQEDSLALISEVDNFFYQENKERVDGKEFTGMIDTKNDHEGIIHDVKSSWDSETFMNSKLSNLYEWQGRVYMELWDMPEFWLRFCLVDCPEHIFETEKWRFMKDHGIIDEEMHPELMEKFRRTLIYSDNPLMKGPEERVKTFKIKRDKEKFKLILARVPHARRYYDTIRLNSAI